MNVLFCAYRRWALDAWFELQGTDPNLNITSVSSEDQFFKKIKDLQHIDVILLVGWSWIIPEDIVRKYNVICYHPSDLPNFAGGSPIQHQILEGIEETNATLFKVTPQIDQGPIILKTHISLRGNMSDIFKELTRSSIELVGEYLHRFPNIVPKQQNELHKTKKRLKPSHSKLEKNKLSNKTCKELYNFIRCKEDPYPNAFIEDGTGKLFFKLVEFVENEKV